MGYVEIDRKTLETLIDAAGEWARELSDHIAPASHDFGDIDSAESQEEEARDIRTAQQNALGYLEQED